MPINDISNSLPAANTAPGAEVASNETPGYRHKVEQAAEKFEAMFIAQMLREMRKVTREISSADSVFKNNVDSDMLEVADGAVADSLARQRSFGIANAILHQLLPAQGAATVASSNAPPAVAPAE